MNGQLVALTTALCWTVTALFFEAAGKRIGSMVLNLLRLIVGMIFLAIYTLIVTGYALPTYASAEVWGWLLASGVVGLALGDLFLFRAFVLIGARKSMLVYASVPVITTIMGIFFLGEIPGLVAVGGMILTIGGIAMVVLFKPGDKDEKRANFIGILFAFLGAFGQAIGLILTKHGLPEGFDPFAANEIRSIGGMIGLALAFSIMRMWKHLPAAFHQPRGLAMMSGGAFFGPFIGVSLSVLALQLTTAGIASTIMSITPVLIIPFSVFLLKERVKALEITGALVAITGVALQFI